MDTKRLLEALPVAVYTTDAEGRITFYNQAAAELWGHRPALGSLWCGSWRLYWPDGRPMPHDECPMAVALKEGRELRNVEAVAERPDGTRVEASRYRSRYPPQSALLVDFSPTYPDSPVWRGTSKIRCETVFLLFSVEQPPEPCSWWQYRAAGIPKPWGKFPMAFAGLARAQAGSGEFPIAFAQSVGNLPLNR